MNVQTFMAWGVTAYNMIVGLAETTQPIGAGKGWVAEYRNPTYAAAGSAGVPPALRPGPS
jgi:hypothetical protein